MTGAWHLYRGGNWVSTAYAEAGRFPRRSPPSRTHDSWRAPSVTSRWSRKIQNRIQLCQQRRPDRRASTPSALSQLDYEIESPLGLYATLNGKGYADEEPAAALDRAWTGPHSSGFVRRGLATVARAGPQWHFERDWTAGPVAASGTEVAVASYRSGRRLLDACRGGQPPVRAGQPRHERRVRRGRNTADGTKVWSTRIGKVGNPNQRPNYPAARSTPTVDGARI